MEALYGSASPMWTTIPSAGFALQNPVSVGNGPIATAQLFGSSQIAGPVAAMASGLQGSAHAIPTAAPPGNSYGYGGSLIAVAPQGVAGLTAAALLRRDRTAARPAAGTDQRSRGRGVHLRRPRAFAERIRRRDSLRRRPRDAHRQRAPQAGET